MKKVISVTLRKGGSGKTTTAVNLATTLQLQGKKTLLIDLDDQANATISVGINPFTLKRSIHTLFTDINVAPQDVLITTEYGLTILPANDDLKHTAVGMTATQIGALKPLIAALRDQFDYIIIDTQPSHTFLSLSALVASDGILIPLQIHYLAMQGLTQVLEDVKKVQNGLNPSLEILGIVPNMVQPNTNIARLILEQVRKNYAQYLLPVEIKYSVKLIEASLVGQPISQYAPNHESTKDYIALAEVIYAKTR